MGPEFYGLRRREWIMWLLNEGNARGDASVVGAVAGDLLVAVALEEP